MNQASKRLSFASLRTTLSVLGLALTAATASAQVSDKDRLGGLAPGIEKAKPFKIGVAVVHLQDNFYKGIVYGIEQEAKRVGAEVVQVSVAGGYGNVREQFAQLEALKALKVNFVAFAPAAYSGYDGALKSLRDAGIKVAAVGIPVGSKNVDFGVLQDDREIGGALADEICKTGKPGTVVTIPGPAGAEWARQRYLGFLEQANKCKGLVAKEGAFGGAIDLQYGLTQTSDLLLRHPEAKYVFTPQITLAMGAAQAIRQQKKEVRVVSSSVVKEAIPMVKDGRILAVVSEPGIIMGRLAVQIAAQQFAGNSKIKLKAPDATSGYPYFNVPPVMLTSDSVDKFSYETFEIPPENWKLPTIR